VAERAGAGGGLRASVLRGGVFGVVGALSNTVGGFLLILVAAHALGAERSGQLFAAVALFTVVINAAKLGADTSLVRFVANLVARHRESEIRGLLRVAVPPTLVGSCLVTVALLLFASTVGRLLYADVPVSVSSSYIRELAWFVPPATLTLVLLAATRGFGSVLAFVMVEQVFKPLVRPLLIIAVILAGGGATAALGAWLAPVVVGLVVAAFALRSQLATTTASVASDTQTVGAGEFWSFATPRALSGFLEILAPWVSVLLLSGLAGSVDAAIFTSVARVAVAGTIVMVAVRLALGPHLSAAFSVGDRDRVSGLHRHSTVWMILLTWPFFVLVAVFPGPVLTIFGGEFSHGAAALTIVATANMLNAAVGNVQTMILMGGRSSWNLFDTGLAVLTQIGLGFLLIPHLGVLGAGIAYGAGIASNNITATLQVRFRLRLAVWSSASTAACALTATTFGLLALVCRLTVGNTIGALVLAGLLGCVVCVAVIRRWPGPFGVDEGRRILRGLETTSARTEGS
jgi:O-antigen/teichoic acid export membrane protein